MSGAVNQLPGLLLPWYQEHARDLPWRADREPYHVWLSEIMLQQTRVKAVKRYYARFLAALPDLTALANAEEETLQKLWEGLGYYTRMRNLQKAAREILSNHGGVFPTEYDAVLALPGIGEYTAGAICSICYEQPTPAVDGNVLRVMTRFLGYDEPIDRPQAKKYITALLAEVYPAGRCGLFTQSLMELGATVCLPNGAPDCAACPLSGLCQARRDGATGRIPVKSPKKARRVEEHTIFLLRCGDRIAVRKRKPAGLLAGLTEFPNLPGVLSAQQALDQASAWGVQPVSLEQCVHGTHIFTHVEWHMTCYHIRCDRMPEVFQWPRRPEFDATVALPTAFRIFLPD